MTKTIIHLQHVPPSTNSLYANVPGRGRVATKRLRTWRQAVGWEMNRQCHHKWTVPVYLTIVIGKLRKNADLSNHIKALEDLLVTHGVIPDDSIQWVRGVNISLAAEPFDGVEIAITAATSPLTAFEEYVAQ